MVTIASLNVNGIRAAVRERSETNRGLLYWLQHTPADIICMQEVRANPEQTRTALAPAIEQGWHWIGADSVRKGRAGVGILSRWPAVHSSIGFDQRLTGSAEFAQEGRYIQAEFALSPGKSSAPTFTVASIYIPAGEAGTMKQAEKERFTAVLSEHIQGIYATDHAAILCGDWNIAHTERDIKNARGNVKNAGFLPEERAWFSSVLTAGWKDVVREQFPEHDGPYSWWSSRGKAFDTDTGWRIDYHITTPDVARSVRKAWVDKASAWDQRWSDHAPVVVDYDLSALKLS